MSAIQNRPNTLPWPTLVYVGAAALAIVAHWLWPLPWLSGTIGEFVFAVGWLIVFLALAMEVAAMRAMARAKTTILPYRGAEHLVTAGPFSFTRNPIYVGNTMLMIGAGLILGIAWLVLFSPVAAFLTQKLAIEREERHLEARFGKKYRDYAKKVRRWV